MSIVPLMTQLSTVSIVAIHMQEKESQLILISLLLYYYIYIEIIPDIFDNIISKYILIFFL